MTLKEQFYKEVEHLDATERWKELNYVDWLEAKITDNKQSKDKTANEETIRISGKSADSFSATHLINGKQDVDEIEYSGYVPELFSGSLGSDFIQLEIDINNGKIKNWKTPTKSELDELFFVDL